MGILFGKYRVLIMAIGLFLILDAAILVLNFYTSYRIEQNAHAIQLANRQVVLSQTMLNELYRLRDALADPVVPEARYQALIDEVGTTFKQFDEAFDAMLYGGEMIEQGQNDENLFTKEEYRNAASGPLEDIKDEWQSYRVTLQPVVYSYFESGTTRQSLLDKTEKAIARANEANPQLLPALRKITTITEDISRGQADWLRTVQVTGISLTALNFIFILYHFLGQLAISERVAAAARKETEEILGSVREGLFLLESDYTIGSQRSANVGRILNLDDEEDDFLEALRPMLDRHTITGVKDYLEVLFRPNVAPELVTGLNPLDEVCVNVDNNDGSLSTKYISFAFTRIERDGRIAHLLVTVGDVTEEVLLRRRLQATEERTQREIRTLLSILHLDRRTLETFLADFNRGLDRINSVLRQKPRSDEELRSKLDAIYRTAHQLKGDCTAVGLTQFEEGMHEVENEVARLRKLQRLSGDDFLSITVALNRLLQDWKGLQVMASRMQTLGTGLDTGKAPESADANPSADYPWRDNLQRLVDQVTGHCGNSASLDLHRFDPGRIPAGSLETVKTFIIQAVRNSITHGIEPPATRRDRGKPETGRISIYTSTEGGRVRVGVWDDGAGLDVPAIRRHAVERGLLQPSAPETLSGEQLLALVFSPGFSTADAPGVHAGRGVGLDLVKHRLDEAGGAVDIEFRTGEYTDFYITLERERSVLEQAV